ncbi:MAG: hypothetical protein ABI567_09690 [Gammaproteobacteria bacterium]
MARTFQLVMKSRKNQGHTGAGKNLGNHRKKTHAQDSQRATAEHAVPTAKGAARDAELEQLRHELRRVTWELDFLKEAASFVTKASRAVNRS